VSAARDKEKAHDPGEDIVVTTYRLKRKHMEALRDEAVALWKERRSGKADASEVLRNILDEWMKQK
jgi:hypothetical protein